MKTNQFDLVSYAYCLLLYGVIVILGIGSSIYEFLQLLQSHHALSIQVDVHILVL